MYNIQTNNNPFRPFQVSNEHLSAFTIPSCPKPKHLLEAKHTSLDYGTLNEFKLDDLVNLQSDGFNDHRVIRLAFVDNHSIHLEEEGV